MVRGSTITRITVTRFGYEIADRGPEERRGLDTVYRPGARVSSGGRLSPTGDSILTIETDAGIRGETPGSIDGVAARYLLGRNALEREVIWHDLKRFYRGAGNAPPGAMDVALWDIAGKVCALPIVALLGGWRKTLPCYASSTHGDESGGLTRPEDYADFALQCKQEFGYPAFKIHGWVNGPVRRDIAAVLAIRKAVGDEMDLMLDPAGALDTFDDVLRLGRACDEGRYLWYEDPFRGGGLSQFAHRKLESSSRPRC